MFFSVFAYFHYIFCLKKGKSIYKSRFFCKFLYYLFHYEYAEFMSNLGVSQSHWDLRFKGGWQNFETQGAHLVNWSPQKFRGRGGGWDPRPSHADCCLKKVQTTLKKCRPPWNNTSLRLWLLVLTTVCGFVSIYSIYRAPCIDLLDLPCPMLVPHYV